MNRWLLIRRLRWPAFLTLFGILALLNQWDVLRFHHSWPLLLILAGLLLLAERTALADSPPLPFPGQPSVPASNSASNALTHAPVPGAFSPSEPGPGENRGHDGD